MSQNLELNRNFPEEEQVVAFSSNVLSICHSTALIKNLYISKIGVFAKANKQYFTRKEEASYGIFIHSYGGDGWVKIDGVLTLLKEGDAFYIPPFVACSYGASKDNPWSIYWMHISGEHAEEIEASIKLANETLLIRMPYADERIKLFNQIFNILSNGYTMANLLHANLLLPSYLATFISFHKLEITSSVEDECLDSNKINKAISYIKKNLERKITVEEVATHIGIASSFFFKKFKKHTGYSPISYINFLKIQMAVRLIHTKKYHLSEIAYKIGIEEPYYFSRLFKKQMGISPRDYIKEFLNGNKLNKPIYKVDNLE